MRARPVRMALAALLGLLGLLLVAGPALAAVPTPSAAPSAGTAPGAGGSRATDIASVARALDVDPLYVSTAPGTLPFAAADVRGALPPDVYVAVLPASAADQVAGETAALPGALLGRLSRPGTVLVLAGDRLEGASRTQNIDRLQQVLGDARGRLAGGDPPGPAVLLAARGLTGNAQLSDPPSATRAGSPTGGGFLYVLLAVSAAAILSVPILLRRARRPAPVPEPTVLRNRVEVDSYGRIVRRVTADELAREQERAQQRSGRSEPPS